MLNRFTIVPSSGGPPPSATFTSHEEVNLTELAETLDRSLQSVLSLLSTSDDDEANDEAMQQLGIAAHDFVEPLGKHEVQLLGCALYMEKRQQNLTYNHVLSITDKYSGKAMNLTMVYKTIDRLVARNLLSEIENTDAKGNRSRSYRIHGSGRDIFRLAILNSRLLAVSKSSAAA